MMTEGVKFYLQIIKKLQTNFSIQIDKQDQRQKVFNSFVESAKNMFKLYITFDTLVLKAISMRLDQQFKSFYYEPLFIGTLSFMKKFTQILIQQKFIHKRNFIEITKKINSYYEDIAYKYYVALTYLKSAQDQSVFRQDFFYRYCGIDDEDREDWVQDDYKDQYCKFWAKYLNSNPNQKIVVFIYSYFCKFQNQLTKLSSQIRSQIQALIGTSFGKTQSEITFNQELRSLSISNMYSNCSSIKQRVQTQYELLASLLNKLMGTKKIQDQKLELRLAKFGSLVSGFAGSDADLDITILTNTYVNQNSFLNYVHDFLKIQLAQQDKKSGRTTKVKLISNANNPLIQVEIHDGRRQGKFKVDILVNNNLGVLNSRFLNVYSQVNWVKQLGILVKLWAKTNGLIGKDNLLSSYAIIIMLIHFLLQKKYINYIYDGRNRNANTKYFTYRRQKKGQPEQFNVYYVFQTDPTKVTSLKNVNLSQILKEFMFYYSRHGEHWKGQGKQIINVDCSTEKQFDETCSFTIKDPFDKPHNPGRAKVDQKDFFLKRFQEGYQVIRKLQVNPKKSDRSQLIAQWFQRS